MPGDTYCRGMIPGGEASSFEISSTAMSCELAESGHFFFGGVLSRSETNQSLYRAWTSPFHVLLCAFFTT